MSAETIWRRVSGDVPADNFFRVDIGLDVEIRDGIWLTSSFGKDFDAEDARSLLRTDFSTGYFAPWRYSASTMS